MGAGGTGLRKDSQRTLLSCPSRVASASAVGTGDRGPLPHCRLQDRSTSTETGPWEAHARNVTPASRRRLSGGATWPSDSTPTPQGHCGQGTLWPGSPADFPCFGVSSLQYGKAHQEGVGREKEGPPTRGCRARVGPEGCFGNRPPCRQRVVCTRGSLCCLALSSLSDAFQTHGAAARKVQRIPRTLHSESPNVNTRHLCFLSTPPPTHRHTCMHPHTHPCASHVLVCGHRATAGPTGRAQGGIIMQKGDFWLQTPKGWGGLVRSGLPRADTRALGRSTHSARSGQPRPAALLLAVTATTRATVNSIGPALPPTSSTPTLSPPWEVDGALRGASGASGRSVASQVTRPVVIKSRLPVPNTHVGGYNADHFADSDHHCCYTYDTPTAALGQSHTPLLSLPPPQA